MKLLAAIRTCWRLKSKPLNVWRTGPNHYEYHQQLDENLLAYSEARDAIAKHPLVERLVKRWL